MEKRLAHAHPIPCPAPSVPGRDCAAAQRGRPSLKRGNDRMEPSAAAARMADFAHRHVAGRRLWRESEFPADLWSQMRDAGLFGIGLPDGGYAAIAAADGALAEHGGAPGVASVWTGHQVVARYMIGGFGTPEQKAAWMPGLASGALTACVAISEAGVGAHPKHLSTTATPVSGGMRLDGAKTWVSNAALSDLIIVFAISGMDGERKRYSAFVVPRDAEGVRLLPGRDIGALRPSHHAEMKLDACVVPAGSRLGPADAAFETMGIPFRDVEDAVGASGMAGTLRHLLGLLAASTPADRADDAAPRLGGIAASVAVAADAAAALAAGLDAQTWRPGAPPAVLTGVRLLCTDILAGMQAYRLDFAPGADDAIDILMRDVALLLNIAKGPRMMKQSRIGMALLRRAPVAEQQGQ
ncbi:MAG: acyl-CoA dehydrogenase family protein [Proteobacteria bacterium]|nr:acyl-CoA dehydrogenase family protein [Pseudomonadota bacterium]